MGAVAVFKSTHHPNHQTLPRMISITPVILCGGSGTRLWLLQYIEFTKAYNSYNCGMNSTFEDSFGRN
jgi:hypothetical protein